MIENAVRLIMQRLRASGIVKEDVTDDAAETIIRLTLNEVFPAARRPWPVPGDEGQARSTFMPPFMPGQPPMDPGRPRAF